MIFADQTCAFEAIDNCLLFIHTKTMASDASSYAVLEFYRAHKDRLSDFKPLVVSDGGGPSALQRKAVQNEFGSSLKEARAVIISDSQIIRFMAAAAVLWVKNVRVLDPQHFGEALDFLGLPNTTRSKVSQTMMALRPSIPPAFKTFHAITGSGQIAS